MRLSAIAFDLDGTLVDSREDLASAVNTVRRELGYEPLPVPEVVAMVGEGARKLVRRALPDAVAGDDFEAAYRDFLDRYYDVCLDRTRLYPGIEAMLEAAAARFPLALLTNKPERHTRKVVRGLGLDRWLGEALGGDSLATRKPDPEPLLELARRLGAEPESVLYVGDSATDGETARRAGSPLALVGWGFGRPEDLAGFECVLRLEAPGQLTEWLAR